MKRTRIVAPLLALLIAPPLIGAPAALAAQPALDEVTEVSSSAAAAADFAALAAPMSDPAGVAATAEPRGTFDYTDDILEDGSLIYYFEELSLTLPASWNGKVMALPGENGVGFYQIASYEKYQAEGIDGGGFLFSISASVNTSFSELPAFEYLGFSEDSAMNYFLILPSDFPAYPEDAIMAEYSEMHGQIDYVVENARFYADSNAGAEADTGEEAAAEDEGATDPSALTRAWDPTEVRNALEHSMFPRYFYDDPQNMLTVIDEIGIYTLWESVFTENGVYPGVYPADQFVERWYISEGDGVALLQVDLPEPDGNGLCYRVYFVYDSAAGDAWYYTVEADEFAPDTRFFCMWTAEMEHMTFGTMEALDEDAPNYEEALQEEAGIILELSGITSEMELAKTYVNVDPNAPAASDLAVIGGPDLGFTTMADPAYGWDYDGEGGLYLWIVEEDTIPYVYIYPNEAAFDANEFIRDEWTPFMQQTFGDDLMAYTEYECYEIGGKQLPAALYTYKYGRYTIEALCVFDPLGGQTVMYTAKYVQGQSDETLAALDTAIRNYVAE